MASLIAADRLQDEFARRVEALAERYARAEINLTEWHNLMKGSIRLYLLMQHLEGTNGLRVGLPDVNNAIRRQHAFLSRFADQIAIGEIRELFATGSALSPAYISTRAKLYGGAGRAVFYRAKESILLRLGAGERRFEYVAKDDGATCFPCSEAAGIYEAGIGPVPGEICLGRSHCRCVRVEVTAERRNRKGESLEPT